MQSDPDKFKHLKPLQIDKFNEGQFPNTVEFKQKIHDLELYIDMFTSMFKILYKQSSLLVFEKDDDV